MSNQDIKSTKIRAGLYEVATERGTFTVELRDTNSWDLIAPNANGADDVFFTKSDAMSAIRHMLANQEMYVWREDYAAQWIAAGEQLDA